MRSCESLACFAQAEPPPSEVVVAFVAILPRTKRAIGACSPQAAGIVIHDVPLAARVPPDHPLRAIRHIAGRALGLLLRWFVGMGGDARAFRPR